MQINGVGNNQIGNSYQNPNRMPNPAAGKKEEDEISKRLEALGVKVELSFRQTGTEPQQQEQVKEATDTEKSQETFSVLGWIKKIWDAGIAWLKSVWNDEQSENLEEMDLTLRETADGQPDVIQTEMLSDSDGDMFEADAQLVSEVPVDEDADYGAMYVKKTEEMQADNEERFRTVGTPLHTSGMQDSYNRYGQHSKLGVEPVNNRMIRK